MHLLFSFLMATIHMSQMHSMRPCSNTTSLSLHFLQSVPTSSSHSTSSYLLKPSATGQATATTASVPESFPTEVPTSPLAASDVSDIEMSSNKSNSPESVAADAPVAQTHFSWETDSEDFDYEHPSHLTAPTAAATPTEALPIPSQLIMPAVPITGTITSSSPLVHATCTTLASCPLCITPSTPPIPAPPTLSHYMGAYKLPRPWDASSVDTGSQATHYYTHSQASQMASLSLGSSPAISISITLDPTQAPQPQSV